MDLVCIVAIIAAGYNFFFKKIDLGYDLLQVFVNMEVRTYSSSLLHAILHVISCSFSKHSQMFCPFSIFLCPFSEKLHPCPYFLEWALEVYFSF